MAASGIINGLNRLNINGNVIREPEIAEASVALGLNSIASTSGSQSDILSPVHSNDSSSLPNHEELLSAIKQLNIQDDGIRMNKKFKYINDIWSRECPTKSDVVDSFSYIYDRCLEDKTLAIKVVVMVASNTFSKVEISEQRIAVLLVKHTMLTYRFCDDLQSSNPDSFRNAVLIFSEYYNKARGIEGQQMRKIGGVLVWYLRMLLKSSQPADIELFTSVLHLNGAILKSEYSCQLSNILCTVRTTLIRNSQLPRASRCYLMLAIDLGNNGFTSLPNNILKSYEVEF